MTQTKTAHTPGPWRSGDRFNTIFGPPNGKPSPETIATVFRGNEANARLLAAAPEMLQALEQLNIIIQSGGDFRMGPKGRHSGLKESLNRLIQKARGGQ